MIIQPIVNIAEICAQKGIRHVVLSPGSRCAHLTIAFVRHPQIKTYTIPDERSAAFVALGMAQKLQSPVALLCTSGTAALNYYPAIAEAYYQQIPLVIFTADRPDEWVDQLDGQTIRQQNVYANHIKKSYHLPVDYSHQDAVWYAERSVNEAINLSMHGVRGPVHVNVPIREPFYPEVGEEMQFDSTVRIIKNYEVESVLGKEVLSEIVHKLKDSKRIMILVGQQDHDPELIKVLDAFSERCHIPVLADAISNVPVANAIHHSDITLFDKTLYDALQPDCIISFGMSILSKSLKGFIRTNPPQYHIRLQASAEIADYTQSVESTINIDALSFFKSLLSVEEFSKDDTYLKVWKSTELDFLKKLEDHFNVSEFSEFEAVAEVLNNLPKHSVLQLANSMSVRYANYLKIDKSVKVYSNRGTSGIDGCTSTALGHALVTDEVVTLITGDMAFLYDRNALWNNYLPKNLRIIVLNNQAGGIFRIIDGPNRQPELQEYFETVQNHTAKGLALDANIKYTEVCDREEFLRALVEFSVESDKLKILEISTKSAKNAHILKSFTSQFKKSAS